MTDPVIVPAAERCLIMGVVNVTPDSFSDGGNWFDTAAASAQGVALLSAGAAPVDGGGQSTRPGAERVPVEEELRRVVPVVRALARAGAQVSVDTTRAEVAAAAVDVGAVIVNDVSGGLADAAMGPLVASTGVGYVCMHSRGPSATMQTRAVYDDVVRDVIRELDQRLAGLAVAGVRREQVAIDPGLGFAKKPIHNWTLLARLAELHELGRRILVGASRKGFLGGVLADAAGTPRGVDEREDATVACTVLAAAAGAWCVRVHEVRRNVDAVRVVAAAAAAARATGGAT
jgi:dihydropteroate synthase